MYKYNFAVILSKGFLVSTNLNRDDQLDVHTFLRLSGSLDLSVTSVIESLVIWQEVFVSSCKNNESRSLTSRKRWFLLVIGKVRTDLSKKVFKLKIIN